MSTHSLPTGRVGVGSVFRLAWPVMIGMLSYNLMNLADTLFVGWLGTVQLAAVGLAVTLSFFVLTPARGMLVGIKVITSQRTGAGEHEQAKSVLWQGVWLSLVLSLFVLALVPAGSQLFWLLGASPEVGAEASAYFLPRVLGAPLLCVLWSLEGWFQGRGDTRTPMVATLVLNAINIALDPLLIFGLGPFPEMGTAGAAWATNIAATVSLGFLLFRARHVLWSRLWKPSMLLIREISKIGLPLSVQWTLDFSGFLVFMSLLAQSGDAELAAHVLVFRVVQVSMLPGYSLADAAGVLVGQAFGARRPKAARQAWWSGLILAATAMTALGMTFVLIPQWLLMPFQPSPE
ncbi:MAG: putative MATE family efflux protein, partial [Kiritimatiellia bacterium]